MDLTEPTTAPKLDETALTGAASRELPQEETIVINITDDSTVDRWTKKVNSRIRPSDVTIRNNFNESILSAHNGYDLKKAYDDVVRADIPLEASLALNRIKKALYFMSPPMVSERIRAKSARLLNESEKNEIFAQCCRVPPSEWKSFQDNCFPSRSRRSSKQQYVLQFDDQLYFSQASQDMACLASCIAKSTEILQIFHSIFGDVSKKRSCPGTEAITAAGNETTSLSINSGARNGSEKWEYALQRCNELAPSLTNTHSVTYGHLTKLDPRCEPPLALALSLLIQSVEEHSKVLSICKRQ
jgi:hypothetical protein